MIGIIDWDKIKKQAPKSLKLYTEWDITKSEGMLQINQRDLFDFFDERDLITQITYNDDKKFDYDIISSYVKTQISNNESFEKRDMAEAKAFEKCFYLLEAILSSDQSKMMNTWN